MGRGVVKAFEMAAIEDNGVTNPANNMDSWTTRPGALSFFISSNFFFKIITMPCISDGNIPCMRSHLSCWCYVYFPVQCTLYPQVYAIWLPTKYAMIE